MNQNTQYDIYSFIIQSHTSDASSLRKAVYWPRRDCPRLVAIFCLPTWSKTVAGVLRGKECAVTEVCRGLWRITVACAGPHCCRYNGLWGHRWLSFGGLPSFLVLSDRVSLQIQKNISSINIVLQIDHCIVMNFYFWKLYFSNVYHIKFSVLLDK